MKGLMLINKTRSCIVKVRRCEEKERKLCERAGFCAKPVPSAELLGDKFTTAAQPPSLLRPSFFAQCPETGLQAQTSSPLVP